MAATKNPLVRLYHIRDEIEGVAVMLSNLEFDRYAESYPTKRAVERALQIISEAVKALPDDLPARYPTTDWNRLRSLGNFLRHDTTTSTLSNSGPSRPKNCPSSGRLFVSMIASNADAHDSHLASMRLPQLHRMKKRIQASKA